MLKLYINLILYSSKHVNFSLKSNFVYLETLSSVLGFLLSQLTHLLRHSTPPTNNVIPGRLGLG